MILIQNYYKSSLQKLINLKQIKKFVQNRESLLKTRF